MLAQVWVTASFEGAVVDESRAHLLIFNSHAIFRGEKSWVPRLGVLLLGKHLHEEEYKSDFFKLHKPKTSKAGSWLLLPCTADMLLVKHAEGTGIP